MTESGLTILEKIPLAIGAFVEVIILDNSVLGGTSDLQVSPREYLVGISSLMTEWESSADESAYEDL